MTKSNLIRQLKTIEQGVLDLKHDVMKAAMLGNQGVFAEIDALASSIRFLSGQVSQEGVEEVGR